MKRAHWLMVGGLAGLFVWGAWLISARPAGAQVAGSPFEHAWLYIPDDGQPVFSRAEQEVTLLPSSEGLSGAVDSVRQAPLGYRLQTRSVRDDGAAALDIFGRAGWEVQAVVPYGKGIKVLLRRLSGV